MIKDYLRGFCVVLCVSLFCTILSAQDVEYTYQLDTLETFEDKLYIKSSAYKDSILRRVSEAYFYPKELRLNSRYLFNTWPLWKRTYLIDSVVNHGESRKYLDSRHYTLEIYDNGKLLSTRYFDSTKTEIAEQDFPKPKGLIFGPCGTKQYSVFMYGDRKPLPIFRKRKS